MVERSVTTGTRRDIFPRQTEVSLSSLGRPLKKSHEATVSETLCNVKSRYVVPLGDFLSGLLGSWVDVFDCM